MKAKPLFISLALFGFYSMALLIIAISEMRILFVAGWIMVGILSYSLTEYLIHRYLFHLIPHTDKERNFQYSIHGNHHENPAAETKVMMRPVYALFALFVISILFYFPLGKNFVAFTPGFVMGYGFYLFIHFAFHEYRPPKNFLRALWKHHFLHHHYCDSKNFGVSSPLWDIVFGTRITSKHSSKKHIYEYHHHH